MTHRSDQGWFVFFRKVSCDLVDRLPRLAEKNDPRNDTKCKNTKKPPLVEF
jgi:hypothetical protein